MVVGGSGDFFEVADNVIMMDNYQAYCVTEKAKAITQIVTTERRVERPMFMVRKEIPPGS